MKKINMSAKTKKVVKTVASVGVGSAWRHVQHPR